MYLYYKSPWIFWGTLYEHKITLTETTDWALIGPSWQHFLTRLWLVRTKRFNTSTEIEAWKMDLWFSSHEEVWNSVLPSEPDFRWTKLKESSAAQKALTCCIEVWVIWGRRCWRVTSRVDYCRWVEKNDIMNYKKKKHSHWTKGNKSLLTPGCVLLNCYNRAN